MNFINLAKMGISGGRRIASKLDKIGEQSLLGRAANEDTERLIPIVDNFVNDTVEEAIGMSPQQVMSNPNAKKVHNLYKMGINRAFGGETGLRWLAMNTPARFNNELEGIIGGVRERIVDDLYEISKINPDRVFIPKIGTGNFTKGHLSVVDINKNNPVMEILNDNLSYIENTIKDATGQLIENSTRFNSFEDFQRKTMNYSIFDKMINNVGKFSQQPNALNLKNIIDFNNSYVPVFVKGEKLRPEILPMMEELQEILERSSSSIRRIGKPDLKLHYFDPQSTKKYDVKIRPEQGRARLVSEMDDAAESHIHMQILPDDLYQAAEREGLLKLSKAFRFDINKMDDMALINKSEALEKNLNNLGFKTKLEKGDLSTSDFIYNNDTNLYVEYVDNLNLDADFVPTEGTFKENVRDIIKRFLVADSVEDNINMKNALEVLDLNAVIGSGSMSPQSLGVYLTEARFTKRALSRALGRGADDIVYPRTQITNRAQMRKGGQQLNTYNHSEGIENTEYFMSSHVDDISQDGVNLDAIAVDAIDLEHSVKSRLNGGILLGAPRRVRNKVVYDPTAKSIEVGNFMGGYQDVDKVLNTGNLPAKIRAEAKTGDTLGGLFSRVSDKKNPNLAEKLALVQSTLKQMEYAGSLRELTRKMGVTQKELVESVADYLVDIEKLAKKYIDDDFILHAPSLKKFKFDEAGNVKDYRGMELNIHHSPVKSGRFMNIEEAVNSLKALVPPIFGIKFNFMEDDAKS